MAIVGPEGILVGGRFALARFPNREKERRAGELPPINEDIGRALDGGRPGREDGLATNRVGACTTFRRIRAIWLRTGPSAFHGKRLLPEAFPAAVVQGAPARPGRAPRAQGSLIPTVTASLDGAIDRTTPRSEGLLIPLIERIQAGRVQQHLSSWRAETSTGAPPHLSRIHPWKSRRIRSPG